MISNSNYVFKSFTATTTIGILKARFCNPFRKLLEETAFDPVYLWVSCCKNNGNNDNIEKFY